MNDRVEWGAREPHPGSRPVSQPLAARDEHLLAGRGEPVRDADQDGQPGSAEALGQHPGQAGHAYLRPEHARAAGQRPLGQLGQERAVVLAGGRPAQRQRADGRHVRAAGPLDPGGLGQPGREQRDGRLVQLAQDGGDHAGDRSWLAR
ncbi:hypothetical protein [Nonomuraea sp. NPDC050202]|uniref:hypothetical protein n=1 Tax=Nonomuraea sp. NPDC050202 TaxID=3155035 RepID=UPI0033F896DD